MQVEVVRERVKRLVFKRASEADRPESIMVLVCKERVHRCDVSPWILIFHTGDLGLTPGGRDGCEH